MDHDAENASQRMKKRRQDKRGQGTGRPGGAFTSDNNGAGGENNGGDGAGNKDRGEGDTTAGQRHR